MKTTPIRDLRATPAEYGDSNNRVSDDLQNSGQTIGLLSNLSDWDKYKSVVLFGIFLTTVLIPPFMSRMQQNARDQMNIECMAITTPAGAAGGFGASGRNTRKTSMRSGAH